MVGSARSLIRIKIALERIVALIAGGLLLSVAFGNSDRVNPRFVRREPKTVDTGLTEKGQPHA
jgi:hypothetical protein